MKDSFEQWIKDNGYYVNHNGEVVKKFGKTEVGVCLDDLYSAYEAGYEKMKEICSDQLLISLSGAK